MTTGFRQIYQFIPILSKLERIGINRKAHELRMFPKRVRSALIISGNAYLRIANAHPATVKTKGSISAHLRQRDEALLAAWRRVAAGMDEMDTDEVARRVADSPAPRLFVSEERAAVVVGRMLKGQPVRLAGAVKREMYELLLYRVRRLMQNGQATTIAAAIRTALAQPAPKFYLTPGSVKVILYRLRRRAWYERRQRLLRHAAM